VVLISDGHGGDEGPRLRDPALGLSAFRSRLYGCFGRRADALFELTDAILTTNTNPSLVHLGLASVHRRGWGSLYAALNKGRIGAGILRNLLARLRLADDPGRDGSKSAAVVRGTVVLVEVERLPSGERRRRPKVLWLWWHGTEEPDLELLWRSYCRRFSIEHAIRFLKERLGWVRPKVRHPEQADRWTWLILAA
jgi:hypothetical protein